MKRRDALRLSTATVVGLPVLSACAPLAIEEGREPAENLTLTTRLTHAMNVKHPFICAGMAFVCDKAALCIAVCQAGGIGALAGSLLSPQVLRASIREIKESTDGPFHVNFLSLFPHEAHLAVCVEEGVPAISFHFGVPAARTVSKLQSAGISVWAQVGSVELARQARDAGADAIIVQGNEAGGHNYDGMPLLPLLLAVKDVAGDTLIFAAGGIADGRSGAAALTAGADAVWVGTLMVATEEAHAHQEYKQRVVNADGEQTVITHVFGSENPAFNPMRVIQNDTVAQWQDRVKDIPKGRENTPAIGKTLFAGQLRDVDAFDSFVPVPETTGDFDKMPMLAGQGVGLVNGIKPAGIAIEELMADVAGVLGDATQLTQSRVSVRI